MKEFKLGDKAIDYIKYSLAGGDALSQYLLKLPLEAGQVTTYLPSTTTELQRHKFEVGGIINSMDAKKKLVSLIYSFLNIDTNRVAIFETLAQMGDKHLYASNVQFFTRHQSEVYCFVTSSNCTQEKIITAIKFAKSYPFIGILTSALNIESEIIAGGEIPDSFFEKLIKSVQYILVGAYDDETILLWSK